MYSGNDLFSLNEADQENLAKRSKVSCVLIMGECEILG